MKNIDAAYGRDLDLNLLRVLVVVAEERSITRAASRLYVSQPAVSASMRRLASFVGAELITRQGPGIALTPRGEDLLNAARTHILPLVAAATAAPLFDPRLSRATIRIGLADCLEAVLLPELLSRLRILAPSIQLVVTAAQFRTVEQMLLSSKIDFAVTVADDLPRSILREVLGNGNSGAHRFACLYDPTFTKIPRPVTEEAYFAQEHVAVSYAGDARGIVEDSHGKPRKVRVSVPAFGYVADVVDGSPLVATVPHLFARHLIKMRPHLRMAPLPFPLETVSLELIWSRATDTDAACNFVRGQVREIVEVLDRATPKRAIRTRQRRDAR